MKPLVATPVEGPSTPRLGEVLDFMRLLWAVDHALHQTSKHMAANLGVTGPQRLVLRIVGRFPGLPAGHLADLLHVHPSTLTGVVQRLEGQGLVRRRKDARDGRRSLLGLTEAGRRLDRETAGTIESAMRMVLRSTPPSKVAACRDVLEAIAGALALPAGDP